MNDNYDYKLAILGPPKAQKRHRDREAIEVNGRYVAPKYDPSAKDKKNLRQVIQSQALPKPLEGPLLVDVFIYFQRPQNHYGTGRNAGTLKANAPKWHAKKPDRDNLDKLVLDALSGIFWRDDKQICDGRIVKQYSERPRTEIGIKVLE